MYRRIDGGFACVAFIAGFGLIAFRDAYGIRPLVMGSRTLEGGETDYMVASESVALKHLGASPKDIVDVKPGEAIIIEKGKPPQRHQAVKPKAYAPDAFEMVYFARPDSVIDGIPVARSRRSMGQKLAQQIAKQLGPEALKAIDVVMAIPETSVTAAKIVAQELGKEFVDGFTKNRYVFRTFIMPNQRLRRTGVRRKLNTHDDEFEGRNVLLVDDSIVRGNTSMEIVEMARHAGAHHVTFASCSPPIVHPHIYGIDLAQRSDLIASRKSPEEIAKAIGADAVVYQTLPDLVDSIIHSVDNPKIDKLEVGVFSGEYITPVSDKYLAHLEDLNARKKREKAKAQSLKQLANGLNSDMDNPDNQDISLHNINDNKR